MIFNMTDDWQLVGTNSALEVIVDLRSRGDPGMLLPIVFCLKLL